VAVELLCALLGQRLELPVAEPLLVRLEDRTLGFGSVDLGYPSFRRYLQNDSDPRVLQRLLSWPNLVSAASFDNWIANPDRHVGNLLFDGTTQFWLIDHGLTLAPRLAPADAVNNLLLLLAQQGRDELALQRLKRELIGFAGTYRSEDARAAGAQIPLPQAAELVDFLTARLTHLTNLARHHLRTRQQDLDYGR